MRARLRLDPRVLLVAGLAVLSACSPAEIPPGTPVVDIVDVSGIIDRPLARYVEEQIDAAERRRSSLLLIQIDSAGIVKISEDRLAIPPLATRILEARVPVAVWVGPGAATIGGGALYLLEAANIAAAAPRSKVLPLHPADLAAPDRWTREREATVLRDAARRGGRSPDPGAVGRRLTPEEAVEAGLVDFIAPRGQDVLQRVNGKTVQTIAGALTLSLPSEETVVRFHKPGPIVRGLHALANPALLYILLIAGAMLLVFEVFQPGFGVAGVSAALLLGAAGYGLTVVPLRGVAMAALIGGLALLAFDVGINGLGVPTALGTAALAWGSLALFPGAAGELRIPVWLGLTGVVTALIFFVPVMTMIRRAREPVGEMASAALVGETGQVRSMLNPEGFVWVSEMLWRARSGGERIRVGEEIVVTDVEGAVLQVRRTESASA